MELEKDRSRDGNRAGDEALADDVFERVKPELAALDAERLLPIKLDLSGAVATVLGVLPEMRGLRAQIMNELPLFDLERFDKLEDYALALGYAHARYLAATQPRDDLEELAREAAETRERLLAEVKALVLHGVVSDARLAQLKGAKGYKNLATDLMSLTNLLREAWPRVEGKIFTTAHDLDGALETASRLLRVVELREQAPAQVADAMDQRVRAFTLLAIAYEDARRAVTYLRAAAGDADSIAPSLYPGRPRPRKAQSESEALASSTPQSSTDGTAGNDEVSDVG